MGSEKVLLSVPTQGGCCHAAGSLAFGPDGNLYFSTGDDTNPFASQGYAPIDERSGRSVWDAQRSASNTMDLRGKILRITPRDDGRYTVPPGNLFPSGGGRPEIYAMGLEIPFASRSIRRPAGSTSATSAPTPRARAPPADRADTTRSTARGRPATTDGPTASPTTSRTSTMTSTRDFRVRPSTALRRLTTRPTTPAASRCRLPRGPYCGIPTTTLPPR